MQNKGLVKLFTILFGLVSIYQLSFTIKSNQIESKAEEVTIAKIADTEDDYASKRSELEAQYIDSLATYRIDVDGKQENLKVFNIGIADFTYNEVKQKAMPLGLDLKGGVSVILQISVKDILQGLTNNSKDPVFNKALDDALELQKNSQSTYLEDFFVAFDAIIPLSSSFLVF